MFESANSLTSYAKKDYLGEFKVKVSIIKNLFFYHGFIASIIDLNHSFITWSKARELSLCHKLKFSNLYIFATWEFIFWNIQSHDFGLQRWYNVRIKKMNLWQSINNSFHNL